MYNAMRASEFDASVPDKPFDPDAVDLPTDQIALRPVLIFPGLMSSALQVKKSSLREQAVGKGTG